MAFHTKVMYVRFIDVLEEDEDHSRTGERRKRRVKAATTGTKNVFEVQAMTKLAMTIRNPPKKTYPKSLSVLEMMRLGQVLTDADTSDKIELCAFDVETMRWKARQPWNSVS